MAKVESQIKAAYSDQYNQQISAWRLTAAKYKAMNIVSLARDLAIKNVLEVGCGDGSILHWLSHWNFCEQLYGVDISESGIEFGLGRGMAHVKEIQLFDGYNIPFADKQFDLVICSHVLEHVEHERILLREIRRVSSHQVFEVPIDFSFRVDKRLNHFLSYGHINIYTPALFRFLLRSENFQVKKDLHYIYHDDILKKLHERNTLGYVRSKVKNLLVQLIPGLKKIKPSSYAVLTESGEAGIRVLQS
jgi:ubiquinone/menaquinone biosynthesis C-methylase UbiE